MFTKPITMMMMPAQKKPSLNWAEVFHPKIKPMIKTKIPEMHEKRIAPIRMRRIEFFMLFSVRTIRRASGLRYPR
jgi:hypothetical protein